MAIFTVKKFRNKIKNRIFVPDFKNYLQLCTSINNTFHPI